MCCVFFCFFLFFVTLCHKFQQKISFFNKNCVCHVFFLIFPHLFNRLALLGTADAAGCLPGLLGDAPCSPGFPAPHCGCFSLLALVFHHSSSLRLLPFFYHFLRIANSFVFLMLLAAFSDRYVMLSADQCTFLSLPFLPLPTSPQSLCVSHVVGCLLRLLRES